MIRRRLSHVLTATLEPGELLFVPANTPHQVLNLDQVRRRRRRRRRRQRLHLLMMKRLVLHFD